MATRKEMLAENIAAMGKEIGETYSALWQEAAYLYSVWENYRALYGHSKKRVERISRQGRHFGGLLQEILYREVILGITHHRQRTRCRKPTLSIKRLARLGEAEADPAYSASLQQALDAVMTGVKDIREQRNMILAHLDLAYAVGDPAGRDVPELSRLQVGAALAAIQDFLNVTSGHFGAGETRFSYIGSLAAEEFLETIQQAERSRGLPETRDETLARFQSARNGNDD